MNVPTMTIGGELKEDELEKLKAMNQELMAKCEHLEQQLREAREVNELAYMRGRCDGLEFSIRFYKGRKIVYDKTQSGEKSLIGSTKRHIIT